MDNQRTNLISVITSPLGFFALSLLIVEGFLTIVLIFSNLEAEGKFYGMLIGAGLFILVVGGVWYLVKNDPKNLTFGERSHLEEERMRNYGTAEQPKSKRDIKQEQPTEDPQATIKTELV